MRNAFLRPLNMLLLAGLAAAGFATMIRPSVGAETGKILADFSMSNNYGRVVQLSEFDDSKIIVLAFIGTECPLAKLYGPRLDQIAQKYGDKGVTVLGISSNKQDSLTELTAYVHRYKITFPVLKDVGNKLADAMSATRTPEIFVLDEQREVRYQGRIDDQYGVGYARESASQSELEIALDELLAGKSVSVPYTDPIGCLIGRVKNVKPTGPITFTKDIAPILNEHCISCHRKGEIGPFTLTSFEDVQGWEDTILEVIEDQRMPPWNANPDFGHFSNDPRLSEEEINKLKQWIASGMPEGDASDLPAPPVFTSGWRIPKPDQTFEMRSSGLAFDVPAEGVVDYQRFIVDPGWTEDKYIYAAEARPDNRSVVHHILVYVIPPGQRRMSLKSVLVGYAPGTEPIHYTDGLAMRIPAGSKLLFEMHYTPNGSPQTDLSYAGVCFMDKQDVKTVVSGRAVLEHELNIKPHDDNYTVTARPYQAQQGEYLLSMTPHMHLRGKAFRYTAVFPNGKKEILLDVPKYDFNWQLKYTLAEPRWLEKGTKIYCTAVYDNSEDNLVNPDPTKTVHWGDQSWDEMMIGFFVTTPRLPE